MTEEDVLGGSGGIWIATIFVGPVWLGDEQLLATASAAEVAGRLIASGIVLPNAASDDALLRDLQAAATAADAGDWRRVIGSRQ